MDTMRDLNFQGTALIPEPGPGAMPPPVAIQAAWDQAGCAIADVVAFWIPRRFPTTKGLTSNLELGMWMRSGKVVLGAPAWAEDMDYIWAVAEAFSVPRAQDLGELMTLAVRQTAR
jgi:hypothetical protein